MNSRVPSHRVILADDHPALLVGVKAVIESSGRALVVGEASTPRTLLELLGRVPCDIVMMDYVMPTETGKDGRDGLDLLKEVRRRFPAVHVIVLTMINNTGLVQAMLSTGARAVLSKNDGIAELPAVLDMVTAGHVFVGKCIQQRFTRHGLVSGFNRSARQPVPTISPKEANVIRLLASGIGVREVADTLHRSPKTVSNQKRSVMRKLGLSSDLDLFMYAKENGVI
ncbi:MAG: response regulator [Janthinobacterium lividum]